MKKVYKYGTGHQIPVEELTVEQVVGTLVDLARTFPKQDLNDFLTYRHGIRLLKLK